jgi:uncharacterized protein involved in exopolysaccharide biosynthesis
LLHSELSKQETSFAAEMKQFDALIAQAEADKAKLQKTNSDLEGKLTALQAKLSAAESSNKDKELAMQLMAQVAGSFLHLSYHVYLLFISTNVA